MSNSLISKPEIYLAAEVAVACIGTLILKQTTYKLLEANNNLDGDMVNFIFATYRTEYKHVQFEAFKTECIITNQLDSRGGFNIKNNILIASLLHEQQFSLVLIGTKKRTFSYINPSSLHPPEAEDYYLNFLQFVSAHNKKYKSKLPDDGWSVTTFNHQLQNDVCDSRIFILNFVNQSKSKIF